MSICRARNWSAALALAATLSACSSYKPTPTAVVQTKPYEWQITKDLAVAVDPYLDAARQKSQFDADLTGANVLAVHIAVENRGDLATLTPLSKMELVLSGGRSFAPVSTASAVSHVGETGSVVGAGIAFGFIGVMMARNSRNKAKVARTVDYDNMAFTERNLAKGERNEGSCSLFRSYRSATSRAPRSG